MQASRVAARHRSMKIVSERDLRVEVRLLLGSCICSWILRSSRMRSKAHGEGGRPSSHHGASIREIELPVRLPMIVRGIEGRRCRTTAVRDVVRGNRRVVTVHTRGRSISTVVRSFGYIKCAPLCDFFVPQIHRERIYGEKQLLERLLREGHFTWRVGRKSTIAFELRRIKQQKPIMWSRVVGGTERGVAWTTHAC